MTADVRELTKPTWEPVTLTEAKVWCRIDDDDTAQDAILLLLISAARERGEAITGRALARRTFELRLDDFPIDRGWTERMRGSGTTGPAPIVIPRPPLVSVQYLTYATSDGDVVWTGSPESWDLDTGGDANPARLIPAAGAAWPAVEVRPGAIRLGFTAGYVTASQMPQRLRLWMQARISSWFENRENIVIGKSVSELPHDLVDGLLDELRAVTLFA